MTSTADAPALTVDQDTDRGRVDRSLPARIGMAWIELRRGAGSIRLRDYFFGQDDPLEQGQMDALDLLIRRDRTMKGLAERLRIEPSTATRAVQRIVKCGLAERYASPQDGRVVMVRITPLGREQHAAVAERRARAMGRIVDSFDTDEQAALADLLERLIVEVDRVVDELDAEAAAKADSETGDEAASETGDETVGEVDSAAGDEADIDGIAAAG